MVIRNKLSPKAKLCKYHQPALTYIDHTLVYGLIPLSVASAVTV